jgi:hypothetical protein
MKLMRVLVLNRCQWCPCVWEYPEEQEPGETEGYGSSPTLSTLAKTASAKSSSKKRGQHGRHKVHIKVHAIHKIGPHGEPLEPETVIGDFSNQCSCIFREHMPITYQDWRKVPNDLKGAMWGEVKRWFEYPLDQFDEDLCRGHALAIVGKALRGLRSHLNKEYVQKGKTRRLQLHKASHLGRVC